MASKADLQVAAIARLRDYCDYKNEGVVSQHYMGQMQFMKEHLGQMSEPIMELKKLTYSDARDAFLKSLKDKTVTDASKAEFLDLLTKFMPRGLVLDVRSDMLLGEMDSLVKRLAAAEPISLLAEEKKKKDRDETVDKSITFLYNKLHFDDYANEYLHSTDKSTVSIDAVLLKARQSVANYCCVLRIPMNDNDTLSPFMLSSVEALVAANERLIEKIREIEQAFKTE